MRQVLRRASVSEYANRFKPMKTHEVDYFPKFDWLRGILAAVVVLKHDRVLHWAQAGTFAVDVFFALSGWLIGGLLLRVTRDDLPRFYFNRAMRIWAPYYIALALLLLASVLHHDVLNAKWVEFVVYKLTFVYNLFGTPQLASQLAQMPLQGTGSHLWSVNAEEQFYLIAPLLLVLAARWLGREPLTWAGLAVLAWMTHVYAAIVFGVLAAVLVHRFGPVHLTRAGRLALVAVGIGSSFGLALDLGYDLIAPVCAICIVLLLAIKGPKRPIGTLVGGMSYPLYLNHWIGVFVGNAALGPWGLRDTGSRQLLAFVLNVGIAVALYWFVDRRLLALRGAVYNPWRASAITYAGYGLVATGLFFGMVVYGRNSPVSSWIAAALFCSVLGFIWIGSRTSSCRSSERS